MQYTTYIDLAMQLIEQAEGFREHTYKCTAGFDTIGFGRNLESNPLNPFEKLSCLTDSGTLEVSRRVARAWVYADIEKLHNSLSKESYYQKADPVRKAVLLDLVFNLGLSKFRKFKKTIQALESQDYKTASLELEDSSWFRQVGIRARRNVYIMETGRVDKDFY